MGVGVFLDPVAPLLVGGGAMLVAALRSTRGDCRAAIAALAPMVARRSERDAQAARVGVNRIRERVAASGIATGDRAPVVEYFLARAARVLADAADPATFRRWAEADIAARTRRHAAVHAVWRAVADTAPAMGMIGTVVALIRMFAAMDDPNAIGPGMALALTTTLWGIVVAYVVAGPVAARLERLSAIEIMWQREAADTLAEVAEQELAGRVTPIGPKLRNAA